MSRDPIDVFADLARSLQEADTLQETLERIVARAVDAVPGAEQAAVSLIRARRRVETVVATDALCLRVDEVQYETGQGPCLDAVWEQEVVRIDDLASTTRWPLFSDRCVELGVHAMVSFKLFVQDDTAGALNMYATRTAPFTDETEHLGAVFAAHAAVAYDHVTETDGLRRAVASRELIGQAQGVLMATHKVTAVKAFAMLREASQHENLKLVVIAERVVQTGALV